MYLNKNKFYEIWCIKASSRALLRSDPVNDVVYVHKKLYYTENSMCKIIQKKEKKTNIIIIHPNWFVYNRFKFYMFYLKN